MLTLNGQDTMYMYYSSSGIFPARKLCSSESV